jgi:hypothetical protein
VDAALLAHEVDRHNVRVVQAGRRLRLVLEALQPPRVEHPGERQHLERHPPPEGDLLGLVDDAHAAPAHLAHDAEVAQEAASRHTHAAVVVRHLAGRRARQLGHRLQGRHQPAQLLGVLRVARGRRLHVHRLAGVHPPRQVLD